MNLKISISVIKLIIFLKKIRYKNEMIKAVKKLICIEYLTTDKKEILYLLPIVKQTIHSVEKA